MASVNYFHKVAHFLSTIASHMNLRSYSTSRVNYKYAWIKVFTKYHLSLHTHHSINFMLLLQTFMLHILLQLSCIDIFSHCIFHNHSNGHLVYNTLLGCFSEEPATLSCRHSHMFVFHALSAKHAHSNLTFT
jgi:hypothetical protein